MSTATPAPATLPAEQAAAIVSWLTAAGTPDTRPGVQRWGDEHPLLELTAERGPWSIWFALDGHTAGLGFDGASDPGDIGAEWGHALGELRALLNDPRVVAYIEAATTARRLLILAGDGIERGAAATGEGGA